MCVCGGGEIPREETRKWHTELLPINKAVGALLRGDGGVARAEETVRVKKRSWHDVTLFRTFINDLEKRGPHEISKFTDAALGSFVTFLIIRQRQIAKNFFFLSIKEEPSFKMGQSE